MRSQVDVDIVDVVVVGAGLAGLTAADQLHRAGMSVRVVEARPRVGGRTLTVTADDEAAPSGREREAGAFDLGATWIWTDQPAIGALAQELEVVTFPQYDAGRHLAEDIIGVPPAPAYVEPSRVGVLRLDGGAQQLCDILAARLPAGSVISGTAVVAITQDGSELTLTTNSQRERAELMARVVVVAVPPRLVLEKITFTPALPQELVRVMNLTPTWMANAIKCVAVYQSPFWRAAGLSGTVFSSLGPLREVHDASPLDASLGAFWGLFSGQDAYREMDPGERGELAIGQFERLFGAGAGEPIQYFERDWSNDPNTNDEVFWVDEPLLDYGHPLFAETQLGGRLVWAGAETVGEGGGHLEGAVSSARRAAGLVGASPALG